MLDLFAKPVRTALLSFLLALVVFSSACVVRRGIMHTVEPGHTLWEIARVYEVDLDLLMKINQIEDARQLRPGTRLVIPGVNQPREIPARSLARRPSSTGEVSPPPEKRDSSPPPKQEEQTGRASPEDKNFDPIWPVQGRLISRFQPGGDVTRRGIRIEAPAGNKVYAAEAGNVKMAGVWESVPQLGNIVIILHRENFATVYAHLDTLEVEEGQSVSKGEHIGTVGKSGAVDKTLCYFEIRYKLKPIDPLLLLGDPL
ncbi:MAG: peptidoglycan DD-metalloendopeptidase family protein [bacterium]